jgi:hypothetical protein
MIHPKFEYSPNTASAPCRRAVAAHQNAECMTNGGWLTIGGCGPTTDLCSVPPDHLRVIKK